MTNLFEKGWTARVDSAAQISRDRVAAVLEDNLGREIAQTRNVDDYFLVGGFVLVRNLDSLVVSPKLLLASLVQRREVPCDPLVSSALVPITEAFGADSEAAGWLEAEKKATTAFLQTERAKTILKQAPAAPPPDSMSQVIEAWSKQLNAEAVMELIPEAEALSQNGHSLADQFASSHSWTLQEKEGVLLVRDQWASLDRRQERPLAALVQLERRRRQRTEHETAGTNAAGPGMPEKDPTYDELHEYSQSIDPARHALWTYPSTLVSRTNQYRGTSLRALDNAVPLLYLWEHLPQRERGKITSQSGKAVEIALDPFADRDLQAVVDRLRMWGLAYPERWHPRFMEALRSCRLSITTKNDDSGAGISTIMLETSSDQATALKIWADPLRFQYKQ